MTLHLDDGVGLWSERISLADLSGRPGLFLDRDGVVVEEVNYLGRPDDVRMVPGVADAIAAANRQGVPVVMVTNQAGIARGYYDWAAFSAVQSEIRRQLATAGASLDLVFACAYHEAGAGPLGVRNHPWRKPNGGMLFQARDMTGITLEGSYIVGDRVSDLQAGETAGLAGGVLVMTGHGARDLPAFEIQRRTWDDLRRFEVWSVENCALAIERLLREQRL